MKQEIKACQGIARFFIPKLKLTKTNKLTPSHVQKKKAPMYVLTDAWCVLLARQMMVHQLLLEVKKTSLH